MKPKAICARQSSFLLPELSSQAGAQARDRFAAELRAHGSQAAVQAQRGRRTKGGASRARKAARRLKTIARQVVRQLERGMPEGDPDRRWLSLARRVLEQKKHDTRKIYSLHEPHVYCLSKGKEHKKYEFGAKASLVVGKNGGVILGAYSLPENDCDGHTVEPALQQVEPLSGYRPQVAIADRGYRGRSRWGDTTLVIPGVPKKSDSAYVKRKARARFRRRAAIEPRIGHLKSDFRLGRNFLKGENGDSINLLLASAASNLSLWMRKALWALFTLLRFLLPKTDLLPTTEPARCF